MVVRDSRIRRPNEPPTVQLLPPPPEHESLALAPPLLQPDPESAPELDPLQPLESLDDELFPQLSLELLCASPPHDEELELCESPEQADELSAAACTTVETVSTVSAASPPLPSPLP